MFSNNMNQNSGNFNFNMNQNISNNNFNNNMNSFPNNNFNTIGFGLNFQNSLDDIDEEWMKGFKMVVENVYKFTFKTTRGTQTQVKVRGEATISQLLEKYLEIVNRKYLILIGNDIKIMFLFNAKRLNFEEHTLVENYFNKYNSNSNIIIIVNDVYGIIEGKEKYITFKGSKGVINSFNFAESFSINELITYFLKSIKKEYLKGNKKISYLYNGNLIKSKDMKKNLVTYFENNDKPTIIVNDSSNLL